jgi:hypothetical protein
MSRLNSITRMWRVRVGVGRALLFNTIATTYDCRYGIYLKLLCYKALALPEFWRRGLPPEDAVNTSM